MRFGDEYVVASSLVAIFNFNAKQLSWECVFDIR